MSTEKFYRVEVAPGHSEEPEGDSRHGAPRLVERKTALRGCSIAPRRPPRTTLRKETEQELKERNPEVPYHAAEKAVRDLVCSLMERQDRLNAEILEKILSLEFRFRDLELEVERIRLDCPDGKTGVSP